MGWSNNRGSNDVERFISGTRGIFHDVTRAVIGNVAIDEALKVGVALLGAALGVLMQ